MSGILSTAECAGILFPAPFLLLMKGIPVQNSRNKYQFQDIDNPQMVSLDHRLLCPQCHETLSRADIESYPHCPFCDHDFGKNEALEDFILEPLVDNWMRQQPGFKAQAEENPFQQMLDL